MLTYTNFTGTLSNNKIKLLDFTSEIYFAQFAKQIEE